MLFRGQNTCPGVYRPGQFDLPDARVFLRLHPQKNRITQHLTGYRIIEPATESHWRTPQEAFGVAVASGEGEAAGAVDFLWCL